jgi:EamA domain-containing membrane protein RarD
MHGDTSYSTRGERALLWTVIVLALSAAAYFLSRDLRRGQVHWATTIVIPVAILLNAALRLGAFRAQPRVVRFLSVASLLVVVAAVIAAVVGP